ncbi:MAG TPA: hypothetical protein VFB60_11830 [Ktedonobacteraceae bacterium]|nr:hypothetical protein [Ktedonobacteraceae bacterium]
MQVGAGHDLGFARIVASNLENQDVAVVIPADKLGGALRAVPSDDGAHDRALELAVLRRIAHVGRPPGQAAGGDEPANPDNEQRQPYPDKRMDLPAGFGRRPVIGSAASARGSALRDVVVALVPILFGDPAAHALLVRAGGSGRFEGGAARDGAGNAQTGRNPLGFVAPLLILDAAGAAARMESARI